MIAPTQPDAAAEAVHDPLADLAERPKFRVPVAYMEGAVWRYLTHGIPPGDFLTALFSNDLMQAFRKADESNTRAMREWVMFMICDMPYLAHGSPERVSAWIAMHDDARKTAP